MPGREKEGRVEKKNLQNAISEKYSEIINGKMGAKCEFKWGKMSSDITWRDRQIE